MQKREIWLLFPHKSTQRPRISYFEALEEALCFGWIDGMVKSYDPTTLSQRFSPRAAQSSWSEVNKQHARLLIAAGKMTPAGSAVLPDLDVNLYVMPEDILEILRKDGEVWKNFCAFPAYYRNIRVAAIDNWRKRSPERFQKTLAYFVEQTRKNRLYGRFRTR
ncbi:MAG: YdeI/OmpD-associated family protein [Puniceicoccales bacterium]|nr:YdeI/OmpD-associated family protein [Puniceicoccales bacterium]